MKKKACLCRVYNEPSKQQVQRCQKKIRIGLCLSKARPQNRKSVVSDVTASTDDVCPLPTHNHQPLLTATISSTLEHILTCCKTKSFDGVKTGSGTTMSLCHRARGRVQLPGGEHLCVPMHQHVITLVSKCKTVGAISSRCIWRRGRVSSPTPMSACQTQEWGNFDKVLVVKLCKAFRGHSEAISQAKAALLSLKGSRMSPSESLSHF